LGLVRVLQHLRLAAKLRPGFRVHAARRLFRRPRHSRPHCRRTLDGCGSPEPSLQFVLFLVVVPPPPSRLFSVPPSPSTTPSTPPLLEDGGGAEGFASVEGVPRLS